MSIYRYCGHCGSSFKRSLDKCRRCGTAWKAGDRFLASAGGRTRICDSYTEAKVTEASLTMADPHQRVASLHKRLSSLKAQGAPERKEINSLVGEVLQFAVEFIPELGTIPGLAELMSELLDEEEP